MKSQVNKESSFFCTIHAFSPSTLLVKDMHDMDLEYSISNDLYQKLIKMNPDSLEKDVFRISVNDKKEVQNLKKEENFQYHDDFHFAYLGNLESLEDMRLTMDGGAERIPVEIKVTCYTNQKNNPNSKDPNMIFYVKESNEDLIADLKFRIKYIRVIPHYYRHYIDTPMWFIYHKEGIPGKESCYLDMILSNQEFAYYFLDQMIDPNTDPYPVYERYLYAKHASINSITTDFNQDILEVNAQIYEKPKEYQADDIESSYTMNLRVDDPYLKKLLQISAGQNRAIYTNTYILYLNLDKGTIVAIGEDPDYLPFVNINNLVNENRYGEYINL